ncbi:MAG: hypothetical protein VXZ82_15060 [Planctomycetota bacterium]|nr:hypothetical protein [Planctomycetota bacterium]
MRLISAVLLLCTCSVLHADTNVRTIDSGHIFIDGVYLPPPYRIEQLSGGLRVNQKSVIPFGVGAGGGKSKWRQRGGGRLERNDHIGPPPSTDRVAVQTVLRQLEKNAILVSFRKSTPVVLSVPSDKADFGRLLLSEDRSGWSSALQHIAIYRDKSRWQKFLTTFKPNKELTGQLQVFVDEVDQIEIDNRNRNAAVQRLESMDYPLTVIGMLLGVVALGINLQWSAAGIGEEQGTKFHTSAIWLILGMSVLDLTWTILSSQAGQMSEMNPMASKIIDSHWKLVVFKSTTTLGACGILYHWRHLGKIQQAAWWATLICVLLTFRWIMMGSFMV